MIDETHRDTSSLSPSTVLANEIDAGCCASTEDNEIFRSKSLKQLRNIRLEVCDLLFCRCPDALTVVCRHQRNRIDKGYLRRQPPVFYRSIKGLSTPTTEGDALLVLLSPPRLSYEHHLKTLHTPSSHNN